MTKKLQKSINRIDVKTKENYIVLLAEVNGKL